MDLLHEFAQWAWARHHNVLSWYIRPLFLIPFCYFAYRRNWSGIATTLLALATSMFWFPVPNSVSPAVLAALEAERQYLLGPWSIWKVLVALLVPAFFFALGAALWRRSVLLGAVVVNVMIVTKIAWTGVFFDSSAFFAHLLPASLGLIACNLALWWWSANRVRRSSDA